MSILLNEHEARVLGCLMEKSVLTPDQYPLTLNSLTNACNQKSSREPVMAMDPGEAQAAVRSLADKHLVHIEENFRRGVEKYKQRFCNTTFSDLQFDNAEFAIICLLLLRGPQTPGELRAHSGRLHDFADNEAVATTLDALQNRGGEALIVKLPRRTGRKDSEYMHLLCGPVDFAAEATVTTSPPATTRSTTGETLGERVARLEHEVQSLRERIDNLTAAGQVAD
ncbi:MAG: DUF480 domain-containing protein [Steroidobacteraceae bacterium]